MLSSCLFNFYAEYILWNAKLDEAQAGIKIAGRNINNLRYADGTTLLAESEEELKSFLMKVKEESKKAGLKLNILKTKIMASDPITSWQIDGETMEAVLAPWKKSYDQPGQHIKKQSRDITVLTKVHLFKAMVFPAVMYGCESWTVKKADAPKTVVLEKTLESPLDCKEIQPIHPKGNQPWIFSGRTDAEAETPILWPPDAKIWLSGKDPDTTKDWRQEENGTTEDEMVGWHHRLDGHEFEQAPGEAEGQGGLACCSPWGHKESDTTE